MPVLVKKMFHVSDMAKEFARLRALAPLLCRGHRRWRALLRGTACGLLPEAAPGVLRRRDRGSGQRAAQAAQWFQGQRRVHQDGGLQGAQEAILIGVSDEVLASAFTLVSIVLGARLDVWIKHTPG